MALQDWITVLGGLSLVGGLVLTLRSLSAPATRTALRLEKISGDLEYIKEKITQATEGVESLTHRVENLDKRLTLQEHITRKENSAGRGNTLPIGGER